VVPTGALGVLQRAGIKSRSNQEVVLMVRQVVTILLLMSSVTAFAARDCWLADVVSQRDASVLAFATTQCANRDMLPRCWPRTYKRSGPLGSFHGCPAQGQEHAEHRDILETYYLASGNGATTRQYRLDAITFFASVNQDPRLSNWADTKIAEIRQRPEYPTEPLALLKSLATKRFAPALRSLGYVYEFGLGVDVNPPIAWAFYDTYNLVSGNDGKDLYRDRVQSRMTEEMLLTAIGYARQYRDMYTDAWKTPSVSIIN
jgi:hypothetical protein